LCAGYKAFFQRVDEAMNIMALLMRNGRPASDVMPVMAEKQEQLLQDFQNTNPSQACPCGRGLTYQTCHGWKLPSRSRRRRGTPVSEPRPPVRAIKT